jgi:prolipoprotein diacylglyceryltransferase
MNYNTDLIIKYRLFLNSLDDVENDMNNICMSEVVYQENFLEAFHLNDYDDKIISKQQTILYDMLSNEDWFQLLLENLSRKTKIDDNEIVFIYLFSYPLFHITHEIIKNFLVNNEVHKQLIEMMNEEIEKM